MNPLEYRVHLQKPIGDGSVHSFASRAEALAFASKQECQCMIDVGRWVLTRRATDFWHHLPRDLQHILKDRPESFTIEETWACRERFIRNAKKWITEAKEVRQIAVEGREREASLLQALELELERRRRDG
jgi:hypothetical protein